MKFLFGVAIATILLASCNKFLFKDVECRNFQIKGENYWFPSNVGDSIVFVNPTTNVRKKYMVVDKQISHRTKYVSDTGCGCLDNSKMLLVSNLDSLWFNNSLRYVEDTNGNYYEDIIFAINGKYLAGANVTARAEVMRLRL